MNDTQPQQHSKEEISGISTVIAENQLDSSLDQQISKLNYHGRNRTIDAVEKSFKDEEHIYVSIFSSSIWIQIDRYICYRLNLTKEINKIQLISLDERNGLSRR